MEHKQEYLWVTKKNAYGSVTFTFTDDAWWGSSSMHDAAAMWHLVLIGVFHSRVEVKRVHDAEIQYQTIQHLYKEHRRWG